MNKGILLLLVVVCACMGVHAAPMDQLKPVSCEDPSALGAAKLALTKINQDRKEGYIFSLNCLCNVNQMPHGPTGMVYYMTMYILETKCHVLSKKENCKVREIHDTPVYGKCRATLYINKVQRIVRLYSYSCTVRPAPTSKVLRICPDCPSLLPFDRETITKSVNLSLEEFNKKSGLSNYFGLLNITRAKVQRGIATIDIVEFTIQETVCSNSTDIRSVTNCKMMDCEFAHKGFCKGTRGQIMGKEHINVNCDIYEPEDAKKEKFRHLLGGEHNHSHTHEHGVEHGHDHVHNHSHDHEHDHKHDHEHDHKHDHEHDHKHDHEHDHKHDHEHDHGHSHEHDHKHDHPGHHHHGHNHTHEHKHLHLHAHEHHHHHHDNTSEKMPVARGPKGTVHYLPSLDEPVAIPPSSAQPDATPTHHPVTQTVPDVHGDVSQDNEPVILPFPTTMSPQCPGKPDSEVPFIKQLFEEDPLFQHKAH